MIWSTQCTPIKKLADGAIECTAPEESGCWEPIGATETHVVWRIKKYDHQDTEDGHAMAELYGELVEHALSENASLKQALVALDGKCSEYERELLLLKSAPSKPDDAERARIYQRGYQACLRRFKNVREIEIVLLEGI